MKTFKGPLFVILTTFLLLMVFGLMYWQTHLRVMKHAVEKAEAEAQHAADYEAQELKKKIEAEKHRYIIVHDGDPQTNTLRLALDASDVIDDANMEDFVYLWENIGEEGKITGPKNESIAHFVSKVAYNDSASSSKEYVFKLTVTDNYGTTTTDHVHVVVSSEPNAAPEFDIKVYPSPEEEEKSDRKKKKKDRD